MINAAPDEKLMAFVIAVGRMKEAQSLAREVLGNNRRQSQQSRLELGLYLNRGFQRANIRLDRLPR